MCHSHTRCSNREKANMTQRDSLLKFIITVLVTYLITTYTTRLQMMAQCPSCPACVCPSSVPCRSSSTSDAAGGSRDRSSSKIEGVVLPSSSQRRDDALRFRHCSCNHLNEARKQLVQMQGDITELLPYFVDTHRTPSLQTHPLKNTVFWKRMLTRRMM